MTPSDTLCTNGGLFKSFNPACNCPRCSEDCARLFEKHIGGGPTLHKDGPAWIDAASLRIEQLELENNALRKKADDLAWLERGFYEHRIRYIYGVSMDGSVPYWAFWTPSIGSCKAKTLGEAIDRIRADLAALKDSQP